MLRTLPLLTAMALLGPTVALAEEDPVELNPITVVGSKRSMPLSEVAGQISVIDASRLAATMTQNLDDLLRYEPGVDMATDGTRFGAESVTIRGIGGNRVAIEIDGVPVRQGFAVGSYANAGRALVETDRVKRLEILHGPASTLYGSDALGGVLAFTTWNPADLAARGRGNRWFAIGAGFDSADDGYFLSGQAAALSGPHGLMASMTHREADELDSSAAGDLPPDPQARESDDYALRYTFDNTLGDQLRIGIEQFEQRTQTDVQSLLGFERFEDTTALLGDDRDRRQQLLVDFNWSRSWVDQATARLFYVDSSTRQQTDEIRESTDARLRLARDFEYDTESWGSEINGLWEKDWGGSAHAISAGAEFLAVRTTELRDGFQENLQTGEISKQLLGETLPTRDFPISETRELGLFLQDEIRFRQSGWSLTPGLRYERYELVPKPDALYEASFPETPPVELSEDRFTPRVALRYEFSERWSVYAQVSEGFRAPPAEDVNIGFDLPRLRFRAIPNPDLESETSRGYEVGLRHFAPNQRLSLTWFDTDFDNLIESRALLGFNPVTRYLEFQSRNIGKARIYGLDLRFDQRLGAFNDALDGFLLTFAGYWSRGENESSDQPLNTIAPPQAVLGLDWRSADERLSAALTTTYTHEQTRIDRTEADRFAPPSSTVLDLTAGWTITPRATLRLGLFNLTNKTYWRWQDVNRLLPTDPSLPLLARPGRSVRVSLRVSTDAF